MRRVLAIDLRQALIVVAVSREGQFRMKASFATEAKQKHVSSKEENTNEI